MTMTTTHSPAIPVMLDFVSVYRVWRKARRGKRPSLNRLAFESRWLDNVDGLSRRLRSGRWMPRRAVCFGVQRPKTREIHAPDFADRIVHHWLVEQLEPLFEPGFIFDSYANRRGKGIHAAVARLQHFMRQTVDGEGRGQGWYLQLDIRDYFYSIHRPTLYAMLKQALQSRRAAAIPALQVQSVCHKLLQPQPAPLLLASAKALQLPPRKRLAAAAPGCGLPIGNLGSQFFANVYLDRLDQFVKHELKVKHYLRYVDDFILLASDAATLRTWRQRIADFLEQELRLQLKPAQPQPLRNGVDFLGYRVYAHGCGVRPRVVRHCRQMLDEWRRAHVRENDGAVDLRADRQALEQLRQRLASYFGHFSHASSRTAGDGLWRQFPWLAELFEAAAWREGRLQPRWLQAQARGLHEQLQQLRRSYPTATLAARCGSGFWISQCDGAGEHLLKNAAPGVWAQLRRRLLCAGRPFLELQQSGYLRHGARLRTVAAWYLPEHARTR